MQKYFNLFILSIVTELWPKENDGAYCAANYDFMSVSNQFECQKFCMAKEACAGISYSGTSCRRCGDDKLTSTSGTYDFFRRPGYAIVSFLCN